LSSAEGAPPASSSAVQPVSSAAAATPAIPLPSERSTPGAVGGDVWDLAKSPVPTPPQPARSSLVITAVLTFVVLLVVLALVLGFVYMFTDLL
jgi:hypothetical protein